MKKRRIKVNFTLIELLLAMSIFVILSLIMMRFFNSAQQIWSKVSQKNAIYADARVALDLMARELQSSMYNNDCTNATTYVRSIYPFWHQWVDNINNTYYSTFEHTQLNFIASTDLKPAGAESNICEIRYGFVPACDYTDLNTYLNNNNKDRDVTDDTTAPAPIDRMNYVPYYGAGDPDNFQPSPYVPNAAQKAKWLQSWEGWLVRSCTADKILKNDGSNTYADNISANLVPNTRKGWNFTTLPLKDTAGAVVSATRVVDIFQDSSSNRWQKIIPGVYSLKFTCYGIDSTGNTVKIKPMKSDSSLGLGDAMYTTTNTNRWLGTPFPVAIKIDLELFASADWFQWKAALANGDTSKAEKIKRNKLRTFTKTVFLDNKASY
jgi:type II secretory pathway pseudopilin PulG